MTADGSGGPAPLADDDALGIEEGALLLGAYAWTEGRMFEVLGAMAADEPWPPATVLFDAHSQQHAWHASLFAGLLPVVPGLEPPRLNRSPSSQVSAALDRLGSVAGTESRLAVLGRVFLPRLVAGYRRHAAVSRRFSDGPAVRALSLVVSDEVEAQVSVEALLAQTEKTAGPAGWSAAHSAVDAFDQLLAGSGPGVVPWPVVSRGPDPGA